MIEAALWERLTDKRVRCDLCAHRCVIANGARGICQVRENREGTLFTLVYGRALAQHADPVEKKPLYHFYPGSVAYSIATAGCNFHCRWCQNWQMSQLPRAQNPSVGLALAPKEIVARAQLAGSRSIAYTYTEPTVFFEYAFETARLARAAGLANVFVTNGYMTAEMLAMIHPYLDAANVDLKAFRETTYRRFVGARLGPVLDTVKTMKRLGIWLEVTTLVIPGINDDPVEIRDAARFVAQELGPDTPWHISRFFPGYKMADRTSTSVAALQRAREIGENVGLHHVYQGNVAGAVDTCCAGCGRVLIRRYGYQIADNCIHDGCCPACGKRVAGVGMSAPPDDGGTETWT